MGYLNNIKEEQIAAKQTTKKTTKRVLEQPQEEEKQLSTFIQQSEKLQDHQSDRNELILKCLFEGLPLNLAENRFGMVYRTLRSHDECKIHPTSVLFNSTPAHIVYTEIIVTSKKYMRFVTDISSVYVKTTI